MAPSRCRHLNDFDVGVETRRPAKVEHPVEAGAQQDDDVGLLQCQRTGRTDAVRTGVVDDALAHGRGQDGNVGAAHQLVDGRLGAGVSHALADDQQRSLRRLQQRHCLAHSGRIGQAFGRVGNRRWIFWVLNVPKITLGSKKTLKIRADVHEPV